MYTKGFLYRAICMNTSVGAPQLRPSGVQVPWPLVRTFTKMLFI